MKTSLLAAEIVRRLPQLARDLPQNAETVIRNMLDEEYQNSTHADTMQRAERIFGTPAESETLRDKFAMAAMPSVIALIGPSDMKKSSETIREQVSFSAYDIADSMLAERNKSNH